ncbi:MAG: hypothetical protein Kow0069_36220 [Promethearchaeota archaeon]
MDSTIRRYLLVHFDPNLGPNTLVQFPPVKREIPQDALLKIWAIHELDEDEPVVELQLEDHKLVSHFVEHHRASYFFIVILDRDDQWSHGEVTRGIAANLVASLDDPNFNRLVSETYKTLRSAVDLREEQVYHNLFRDKTRRIVLNILRKGAISKQSLIDTLEAEFGFTTTNLELLLTPFYQLELVVKQRLYETEVYFLQWDVACFRFPPASVLNELAKGTVERGSDAEEYLSELRDFFQRYDPVLDEKSGAIFNLMDLVFSEPCYEAVKLLRRGPLREVDFLGMFQGDRGAMVDLFDSKVITKAGGSVYLLSDVVFEKFCPLHVHQHLVERFVKGEIPVDYLLRHVELLESVGAAKKS